ncbi:MAG: hypoxanthine phosphoribosyltransferase [Bacteroidetes bacterium]|nr:hypoxanthine phosphoribosyltransferase [Bacteroidota bacterium]
MSSIQLGDKEFVPYLSEEKILSAVRDVAAKVERSYSGKKPLFIVVLNGSFLFAADLLRNFSFDCEVSFVKMASYSGTSSGNVTELIGLNENISGRDVVIVEDIIDTGNTITKIFEKIIAQQPSSVKVATLLFKPGVYKKNIPVEYIGLEIPNDFIVGYGLDYNGLGRNLRDIYVIKKQHNPL